MWWLPLATSVVSGISNLLSGDAQAEQQRKNIALAQKELSKNLVSQEDLDKFLQANKMAFGRQLSSLMNTTAIKSGGISNSNVVKAAVAAPVAAAEVQSESDIRYRAQERNSQIRSQLAQLSLGTPASDPVGDFVSGAASGASLGIEMGKYVDGLNKLDTTDTTTDTTSMLKDMPTHNPNINGNTLSFGAENLNTALNSGPKNPYVDFLGDDQLMQKQKRWQNLFNFNPIQYN